MAFRYIFFSSYLQLISLHLMISQCGLVIPMACVGPIDTFSSSKNKKLIFSQYCMLSCFKLNKMQQFYAIFNISLLWFLYIINWEYLYTLLQSKHQYEINVPFTINNCSNSTNLSCVRKLVTLNKVQIRVNHIKTPYELGNGRPLLLKDSKFLNPWLKIK